MNTILFDLDGTLLPMDTDVFTEKYFKELCCSLGDMVTPKELIKNMWSSTKVMIENIEDRTNEDVFMSDFSKRVNGNIEEYQKRFDEFYDNNFLNVKECVSQK